MFGRALGDERELGIDFWQHEAPRCASASLRVATSDGSVMVHIDSAMDIPGQSIDQRVKVPRWMRHFETLWKFVSQLTTNFDDGDSVLDRLLQGNAARLVGLPA